MDASRLACREREAWMLNVIQELKKEKREEMLRKQQARGQVQADWNTRGMVVNGVEEQLGRGTKARNIVVQVCMEATSWCKGKDGEMEGKYGGRGYKRWRRLKKGHSTWEVKAGVLPQKSVVVASW